MNIRGYAYGQLYLRLPSPRIRLTGLAPLEDLFWDGTVLRTISIWWNAYLDRRPECERARDLQRIDQTLLARTVAALNPANRDLFVGIGSDHSPGSRLGVAALSLAYSFARTLYSGNPHWKHEDAGAVFTQAEPISPETLEHYSRRYTILADYEMWVQSPGWWAERERQWFAWRLVIPAMRWAFTDQVKRWEIGEGRDLGKGIGWSTREGEVVTDFRSRLFELGGRLLEAEVETISRRL